MALRLVAVAVAAALAALGEASGLGFDLHHRSSSVVKRWAEARGHPAAAWWAHAQGSPEHYSALSRRDRARLARRGLADSGKGLLTFADGNITYRLDGSYALPLPCHGGMASFLPLFAIDRSGH
jgi:hypothetical protein